MNAQHVLVALFGTQPVIDIQNVVIVIVVVAIIMRGFAGFGQHPTRIMGGFIAELGVAYAIRLNDVRRKLAQRLNRKRFS